MVKVTRAWMLAGLAGIVLAGAAGGCGGTKEGLEEIRTGGSKNARPDGRSVEIVVKVGEGWNHKFRLGGVLPIDAPPQLAVWTETDAGAYSDTLFVTRKFARQSWGSGPAGETFRIEALPVWAHRYMAAGHPSPTSKAPLSDAVAGPTPTQSFRLRASVPSGEKLVRFSVEVNVAYDGNAAYPTDAPADHAAYNGASGQPSLVYSGTVDVTTPGEYKLTLAGHGHPSGADGRIYAGTDTLTTVRELIESCTVVVF